MARAPITRNNPYTPHSGKVAGQTSHSERQYRNALARGKGFASWYQQQRAPKPVRTPAAAKRLTPAEREARQDALQALSLLRQGTSLSRAAKEAHTTPNAVQRYAGSALIKDTSGRYIAKARDKLYRPMRFLAPNGSITLDVRDNRTATRIARYMNAVRWYVRTGDDRALTPFRGKSIQVGGQRYDFVTDLDLLDRLGNAGELRFEDLYDHTA